MIAPATYSPTAAVTACVSGMGSAGSASSSALNPPWVAMLDQKPTIAIRMNAGTVR